MSLFGTSPDAKPSKIKSSLFDDETPIRPGPKQQASGLFADSTNDDGDSPWGFISPKKQSRGNPVKTLLSATEVPESYIDAYDALLESGERIGNGLSLSTIKRLLGGTGLGSGAQSEILRIVQGGQDGGAGFGRAEFNVLLALVGLAQEGEEATLDGVDERRRRLPQPRLPQLRAQKPIPQRTESEQPPPAPVPAPPLTPATRAQSFGYSDSDPWGTSPPVTKPIQSIAAVENGASTSNVQQSAPVPQRTTSTFTTTAEDLSTSLPPPPPIETSTGQGNDGWGVYNGSSGADSGGFGDSPVEDRSRQVPTRSNRAVGGGSNANPRVEELVIVETLQEKEGMFLFQHRNYEVTSARRNSKVIRRYSDFVWLLDCLHKRYPFRQLPLLPPKRVAINGNHIASDNLFIEKRRRGLARFANALVRHPVLNQEQLVIMFLTVPTVDELAVWRKQATITVQEEFVGKALPLTLEESLPPTLEELFQTVRNGVRRSTEIYINMCVLLERLIKRKEGLGSDYMRLSSTFQLLTEASPDTYKIDSNDVPLLNEGILATAKHISTNQSLLQDEARAWEDGVLEDLKRQRDGLVSMRDMFDRRDRLAKDNIPQLERRIANNENKLAGVRAKPEGMRKPGEIEKLEDSIFKDKDSILQQHARGVFIKECVRDEILAFQSSQYHVSRMHQDWAQERVKYAELMADNWRGLAEELEGMPGGE